MQIREIDINTHFTSTEYDPSPNRINPDEKPVSERKIPIVLTCPKCDFKIHFKTENFEKYHKDQNSNLIS